MSGSDLDVKVLTKSYNLSEQEIYCNIYNTNSFIDMQGDYMAIYLINGYVDKVLGFVVVNCSNCDHKESGFNVKVGDN